MLINHGDLIFSIFNQKFSIRHPVRINRDCFFDTGVFLAFYVGSLEKENSFINVLTLNIIVHRNDKSLRKPMITIIVSYLIFFPFSRQICPGMMIPETNVYEEATTK